MASSTLPSLLLLPPPPVPASRAALSGAYRPALAAALAGAQNVSQATTLIVAVPLVSGPPPTDKQFPWPAAQALLAGLYTVIAVLSETLHISTDVDSGPGSVDVRVVLLDYAGGDAEPAPAPSSTVLVGLASFAAAQRPWHRIYHVQSEAGLQLHRQFLQLARAAVPAITDDQLIAVPAGIVLAATAPQHAVVRALTPLHRVVCLGGTFDHLHLGHKLLLTAGALLLDVPASTPTSAGAPQCEYVIGITGDELLRNKKYAAFVQAWDVRARAVIDVLGSVLQLARDGGAATAAPGPAIGERDGDFRATFRNGSIAVQCVRIHDPFGPTIERADITCLVVSGETRSGGRAVNERRAALGWPPLETFEVDVLSADEEAAATATTTATESFDAKISSTAIRRQRAEAAAAAAAATTGTPGTTST